jgi:hypothetical protein
VDLLIKAKLWPQTQTSLKFTARQVVDATSAHLPLHRYRTRTRKLFGIHPLQLGAACRAPTSSALTPQETAELAAITKATQEKLKVRNQETELLSGGSSGDLPSVGRLVDCECFEVYLYVVNNFVVRASAK